MIIRREAAGDADVIRAVVTAAFARPGVPGQVEARLVDELRAGPAWLPALSMVAVTPSGEIVGHVLCTRAHVGEAPGLAPVLALGPLSVRPGQQRAGLGSALVHAALGAGDALGEPVVVLLGDPGYYQRFGFRLGSEYGITPAVAAWQPHFQVRTLSGYQPSVRGAFRYAEPFDRT
jgi:putative acetyltransferase